MKRTLWAAVFFLLAGALTGKAEMVTRRVGTPQRPGAVKAAAGPKAQPPVAYVPQTASPPAINGTLDDEVWTKAAVIPITRTLDGMGRASQPTEVRLLRDADNLYIGLRSGEPLISRIQGSARGRDGEVWSDDSVEIFLGVKNAGAYYHFGINAFGSTYDGQVKDAAWNSGLRAAALKAKDEWTAELAIPLAKMTGAGKQPTEWIANFNRNRYATGSLEEFAWSPTYSGDSHMPEMFGELIFGAPPAEAKPAPQEAPVKVGQVEVTPVEGGEGIVRFDLSFLPAGAKVYRADLLVYRTAPVDGQLDEARIDIEVYPLFGPVPAGREPKTEGVKPLALRAPWFDRLDATEAVRQWASGKGAGAEAAGAGPGRSLAFYVKACPFWDRPSTCLDVAYEGKGQDLPPQVTGVAAFHRAGQTFITWKEITDPVGAEEITWGPLKMIIDDAESKSHIRYCVYRSDRPITPASLPEAELVAQVRPLSCWNVNGRNVERAIDIEIATKDWKGVGQWNPFGSASADGDYGRDCPIDRLQIVDVATSPFARGIMTLPALNRT